ncbi:MAG: FliA/WhiG family RNA polymerase sigma factor [Actinobacteria bacterium]|nr:FliA/WhiG family RNA polymerase sigma factor [Actinomycetota bacterium]MBV9254085.1 FliA/WhiG family RNA polymerase sigma factor [Actinomycetota bacterium]
MGGTHTNRDLSTTQRDEEALVRDHLPLVHYAVAEVAARVPRHVSRDDLISAGMAGLAHAARNFDPERGIRFDRYAAPRIRGALLDELRHGDWASRSVRRQARSVRDAAETLTMELGRTPTNNEIADKMGCDQKVVEALNEDVHRAVVLNYDSLVAQGSADEVMPAESRTPDSILLDRERQAYLVDAVAALPERLRRVVVGYFFEERSMQELADELGVTDSRISQIRAEALELLREGMNSQLEPEAVEKPARSQRVARRKQAYYAAIAKRTDAKTRISTDASLGSLVELSA